MPCPMPGCDGQLEDTGHGNYKCNKCHYIYDPGGL